CHPRDFHSFPTRRSSDLSEAVTGMYYLFMFDRPLKPDELFHVGTPINSIPDTLQEEVSIKSYFCGLGPVIKPLLLEAGTRLTVGGVVSGKMEHLRQVKTMLEGTDLLSMREALKSLDARLLQALQEQATVQAGILPSVEIEERAQPNNPEAAIRQIKMEWSNLA